MRLKKEIGEYYIVREGDDVSSVCRAADVSERAFVKKNGTELCEGQLVFLPPRGNLYTVRAGDSAEKLCGSRERFEELNGTGEIYIGRKVRI